MKKEEIIIGGKKYFYCNDIRENNAMRQSFNELAKKMFNISFQRWYESGYWQDRYIPHVLLDGDKVVANISVNVMKTAWNNIEKIHLQLGTVMTDELYRKKSLSDFLMRKVFTDWVDKYDAMYLFANDSVLDFYPKYGFVPAKEFQCSKPIERQSGKVRKLDMSLQIDRDFLLSQYKYGNRFSQLPLLDNEGLVMFHCTEFLQENIFYLKDLDVVAIVEYDEDSMLCYDVYSKDENSLDEILASLALAETKTVRLGFMPLDTEGYEITELQEEDLTLFVLKGKENLFENNRLMFPLLSHA